MVNEEIFQAPLYQRSQYLLYQLAQLRASIREVDDESQAWKKLAIEVRDKLLAAVEAAKKQQAQLANYNSTTTINTDPGTSAIIRGDTDPHIKDGW